jgi:1-acyl-sn-glycerol-3-phosphate acyltransferase
MHAEDLSSSGPAEVVVELVRELAPRPRAIHLDDKLAELGLDSLACADLAIALEERLGIRLPDVEGLELETVGQLATVARRAPPARDRIRRGIGSIQRGTKLVGGPIIRRYSRLRVEGAEHFPLTGPAVISANHRSMLDIPIMVVAAPRPVYFMAKSELYGDPVRRWVWHHLGGFPVRRHITDLWAIDTALALLERGDTVVLYPEGRRSRSSEMLPFLLGSAWLALKVGAPLVPCGVIGTGLQPGWNGKSSAWRGKHVRARFGEPIQVTAEREPMARRLRAEELTGEVSRRIADLLP